MAASNEKPLEIVPLNDGWNDFDLERTNLEELEQRFELSLLALPPTMESCAGLCENDCDNCGQLSCCTNE